MNGKIFGGKKIEYEIFVLIFTANYIWNIFHCKSEIHMTANGRSSQLWRRAPKCYRSYFYRTTFVQIANTESVKIDKLKSRVTFKTL